MLIEEQADKFAEMERYNKISNELDKKILELENELNLPHLPFHIYSNICANWYDSVIQTQEKYLKYLMQIKNKVEELKNTGDAYVIQLSFKYKGSKK